MARTLFITIPGTPLGKPRMTRRDKWAQRKCVLAYRAWADLARLAVIEQLGAIPPAEEVARLDVTAYFAPPKSWTQKQQAMAIFTPHRVKPDADNVLKSLLDALWKQDSAIFAGSWRKLWDWEPRLEVTIELTTSQSQATAVSPRKRAA